MDAIAKAVWVEDNHILMEYESLNILVMRNIETITRIGVSIGEQRSVSLDLQPLIQDGLEHRVLDTTIYMV